MLGILVFGIIGGGWFFLVHSTAGYQCQDKGNCGSPDGNVNHQAGAACHLNHHFYTTPEELREGVEWCIEQQNLWIATSK